MNSDYIITLDELKTFLSITDDDDNAKLELLIDTAIDFILQYTKNDFTNDIGINSQYFEFLAPNQIKINDTTILEQFIKLFSVDNIIKISNTLYNNEIAKITDITDNIITLDINNIKDESDVIAAVEKVEYPTMLKKVVADIVNYDYTSKKGIASERLGDYSVSYENNEKGYPAGIINSLKSFKRVKFI